MNDEKSEPIVIVFDDPKKQEAKRMMVGAKFRLLRNDYDHPVKADAYHEPEESGVLCPVPIMPDFVSRLQMDFAMTVKDQLCGIQNQAIRYHIFSRDYELLVLHRNE